MAPLQVWMTSLCKCDEIVSRLSQYLMGDERVWVHVSHRLMQIRQVSHMDMQTLFHHWRVTYWNNAYLQFCNESRSWMVDDHDVG